MPDQFSEIGDKTFLIAAILAMRRPPWIVFAGAFTALALMSVLSAVMGAAFPALLPKAATTLMASVLFFAFGLRMMREARQMDGSEMAEEWKETARELDDDPATDTPPGIGMDDLEAGQAWTRRTRSPGPASRPPSPRSRWPPGGAPGLTGRVRAVLALVSSPTFAQALVLTFLGEWGDRSQIATIALAAAHNVVLVSLGTIAGHCLCTMAAVTMGSWLAARISVRQVTLGGALLFLLFGFIYLYESFTEYSDPTLAATAATLMTTTSHQSPAPTQATWNTLALAPTTVTATATTTVTVTSYLTQPPALA